MVVAAAMGRRWSAAARWLQARRVSSNGTNGGRPATPANKGNMTGGAGGPAANGSGGGTCSKTTGGAAATATNASGSGISKATGGGAATNGSGAATGGGATTIGGGAAAGGGHECLSVAELRREAFHETGRVWEGYNRLCEADRILYEQVATVYRQMSLNFVKSKEDLVSTTYKLIGSACVFALTFATWASPTIHDSLVNDTVQEVERRARLKKALPTKGDDKSSGQAAAPTAADKADTTTAGAPVAAASGARCGDASLK